MNEHTSNVSAFAAAIAGRYGEGPLIAPLLDLTVRLNPRMSPARITSFDTRVEIAPRLAVTFVNNPPTSRFEETGAPAGPGVRPDVVRRLARRRHRVESPATPPATDLRARPAPRPASTPRVFGADAPETARHSGSRQPTLPMILCRPTRAAAVEAGRTENSPSAHPPATAGRPKPTRTRVDGSSPQQPVASVDVDQLTDKVIRAIDRRIVAYRERTARS
jgi:hypothetical protein